MLRQIRDISLPHVLKIHLYFSNLWVHLDSQVTIHQLCYLGSLKDLEKVGLHPVRSQLHAPCHLTQG